jgi:hypothetical protein
MSRLQQLNQRDHPRGACQSKTQPYFHGNEHNRENELLCVMIAQNEIPTLASFLCHLHVWQYALSEAVFCVSATQNDGVPLDRPS